MQNIKDQPTDQGTDSPGCSSKDNIPPEEATSINQEDSSVTEDEVGTIKLVTVEYAEDDYDENFSEEVRYLQSLCSEETTSKQLKSDEEGMNLEEQENTRIKRKVSQIAGAESTITLSPSKSQHQKMAIFTNPLLPQKMNPGHHGRRKKKSGGAESTTTFSSPKSQHQKMAIFTNPLLPQKMNPGHQKQSAGAESTTTLSPSKSQHQKMAIFTDPLLPQNITYGPQTQSGKSQHQPGIQGLEGQTTQLYVDKQVKQPSYQPLPHPRKIQTRISRNSLVSRSHKHFHSSSSQIKQIPTDIICLPAEYPEDNHTYRVPWGKVREQLAMLGLVGKIIIQTWWTYENFKMEVVALFQEKFNCSVNDFSFTFLQCLPGNQKLIKPNVSYFFKWNGTSISNLIANGALYIKIKHPLVDPNASIIIKQSINTQGDSEKMGSAPSDNQTVDIKPPTTNYSLSPTIQKSPRGAWSKFETPMHYGLIQDEVPVTGLMLNEGINQKKSANVPENVFSLPTKHTDQSSFEDCTRSETSYHTMTTNCIFKLLQDAGIKTSVVTSSQECEIIPIEWACWRIATDMYLRRNPHAVEENRLSPPKVEMFWKNGDNNQLVISVERLVAAGISCAGLVLGQMEVDIMNRSIVAMLEILERTCLANGIVIVNLKVKFGVEANKKEIVLADVVGYESRSQIYTDILGQQNVECPLSPENQCKVVLLTESLLHLGYCEKIKGACAVYNIPCELRVISAYTGPAEILDLKSQYEGDVIPMVFITVAGKSNSLASVMSANITYPVINCPLVTAEWTAQDLCSAVRMAEGIGFSTVLSPEAAAQFAAHILGLSNPLLWSKLRTCTLNKWIAMKQADVKLRECSI